MDVIMPAYILDPETMAVTESAVKSLRENDIKLIIIDNGSVMGHGQLREWADLLIYDKVNIGYARAVNQGLKLAGKIVAVANNDIRVPPQWLPIAEDVLEDPKIGSLHYRMIPYDQPFNPSNETWPSGKERWCTSSFFVVRNVQLYDENFRNSYDDWDFWSRMREKGYTTAYTNKAEYQHLDSFTVRRDPQHEAINEANKKYYIIKHGMTAEEEFENLFPGELAKPWKPFP